MGKLGNYSIDVGAAVDGKWFPFEDGIEFKIAKWNNPQFKKYLEKLSRPHERLFRKRGRVGDQWQTLVDKAAARFILLDWKSVDDESGKTVKYTETRGLDIFTDPAHEIISNFILGVAMDEASWYADSVEESEKN